MIPSIPLSAGLGAIATAAANDRIPTRTLDQQDFLKLLVTQMTSMDPLNPKGDLDFIGQMAQFTSLEQSKGMQQELAQLRANQEQLQAASLLGRQVVIQTGSGSPTQGIVERVELSPTQAQVVVAGTAYSLGQIQSISPDFAV